MSLLVGKELMPPILTLVREWYGGFCATVKRRLGERVRPFALVVCIVLQRRA